MNVDRTKQKLIKSWSREYKKGLSAYFLLLLMKEEPTYGFDLSRKLQAVNQGHPFGESGIYQQLKKLESAGLVNSEWRPSDQGPRRKYYMLTPQGAEVLDELTHTMFLPMLQALSHMLLLHYPALSASLLSMAQTSRDHFPGTSPQVVAT